MTAETITAGAFSRTNIGWHDINWRAVNESVRRLQARIVKATQEGRWNKVRALQHLLTRSFSGKVLAVRRVTENRGRRTPGVDNVVWNTPAKKMKGVQELRQRGYTPSPLRRLYIKKKHGKRRPLGIPTMTDRAMQALYLLALDPVAETTADPNSYGFRKERSTADAIEQCYIALGKGRSPAWILEGDIKSCFDRIDHHWLLAHIPMERSILSKWLKAGFMEANVIHPTQAGTPQGGIASPVLANFALDGLEKKLRAKYPIKKRGGAGMVNVVRYADDFIITGRTKELLETEVRPLVEEHLNERGLELSPEKTKLTHITEGFDFLGKNIRKYNGKMLIKPSKENVKAFLAKVREKIRTHKQVSAGELIRMLNPVIRGWAMYHRHKVSSDAFHKADHDIFEYLWRWAKRRHRKKSLRWLKAKYFKSVKGNDWLFYGAVKDKNGKRQVELFCARAVLIRRHVKVKAEANPYDPQWEAYFEHRHDAQMEADLSGRRKLLNLWRQQQGRCPHCQQSITRETGWNSHHLVWRCKGGSDGQTNRVLLHPNCHRQVHSQRLEVVKPGLAGDLRKA